MSRITLNKGKKKSFFQPNYVNNFFTWILPNSKDNKIHHSAAIFKPAGTNFLILPPKLGHLIVYETGHIFIGLWSTIRLDLRFQMFKNKIDAVVIENQYQVTLKSLPSI